MNDNPMDWRCEELLEEYRIRVSMPDDARVRIASRLFAGPAPLPVENGLQARRWLTWGAGGLGVVTGVVLTLVLATPDNVVPAVVPPTPRSGAVTELLVRTPLRPPSGTTEDLPHRAEAREAVTTTAESEARPTRRSRKKRRNAVTRAEREHRIVRAAWRSVERGHWKAAQRHLARHSKLFPDGFLAPERKALERIVECSLDLPGARERAQVSKSHGVLATRVARACGE